MVNSKKWVAAVLTLTVILLGIFAAPTIILDPLFHYHKPLPEWEYRLRSERYQNDGILKHFDYNALITGSSMTENYKTSELEALWPGTEAIKIPFSGGGLKEIGETVTRAADANPDLAYVFWGLDLWALAVDKDRSRYDSYPEYLYDNYLWNDVEYFLNKEILLSHTYDDVIKFTLEGGESTSFDSYANWMRRKKFGRDSVMESYTHVPRPEQEIVFGEEEASLLRANVEQNIIPVIEQNPDIRFYIFFHPVSIAWWDYMGAGGGKIQFYLDMIRNTVELILPYENVELYSFFDEYDLICDLSLYTDFEHYKEDVNSQMLRWMRNEEHRLTQSNYQAHFDSIGEFYNAYDYELLAPPVQ